jgi:hypothetical protein
LCDFDPVLQGHFGFFIPYQLNCSKNGGNGYNTQIDYKECNQSGRRTEAKLQEVLRNILLSSDQDSFQDSDDSSDFSGAGPETPQD